MLAVLISILMLEKHFERQSNRKVSVIEKIQRKKQTQQTADRKVSDRCGDGRDHLLHGDSNCPSFLQEDTMSAIHCNSLSLACCLQWTLTGKANKVFSPHEALVFSLKTTYLFCSSQDQTKKSALLISPTAHVDTHSLEPIFFFASALIHWEMSTFIYLFWDTVLDCSSGWPGALRPANLCFLTARIKVCVTTPGLNAGISPKHLDIRMLRGYGCVWQDHPSYRDWKSMQLRTGAFNNCTGERDIGEADVEQC